MRWETFRITMKTITPVCIRAGDEWFPYDNNLRIGDFRLDTSSNRVDIYTFDMQNGRSQRIYSLDIEYAGGRVSRIYPTVMVNKRGVYIPGSSLKGAFRTAFMYHLIRNDSECVGRIVGKYREIIQERDCNGAKPKYLQKLYEEINREIMGKPEYDVFKWFIIRDTTTQDVSRFSKIYKLQRYNIGVFQYSQCIKENVYFETEIKFKTPNGHPGYTMPISFDNFWRIVKEFYREIYNFCVSNGYDASNNEVNRYLNMQDADKTVLRIGFGKNIWYQTFLKILYDYDRGLFDRVIRHLSQCGLWGPARQRNPSENIPLTNWVVVRRGRNERFIPLGWIVLMYQR